jgi:hypothetical protein
MAIARKACLQGLFCSPSSAFLQFEISLQPVREEGAASLKGLKTILLGAAHNTLDLKPTRPGGLWRRGGW